MNSTFRLFLCPFASRERRANSKLFTNLFTQSGRPVTWLSRCKFFLSKGCYVQGVSENKTSNFAPICGYISKRL